MTNQNTAETAVLNTLEAEGKALAEEWTNICKADKSRFTKSTKADGFDTRLGKLMFALKQESEGRIPSARLKECGINSIDKRRRSEALWFVENEDAARDFIKASKKGFTSLTALQAAMRKADKSAKADEQSETDDKSNVGPTESETQEQSVNELDIVIMVMEQCGKHHIAVDKVLELLQSEVDNTNQKAVA